MTMVVTSVDQWRVLRRAADFGRGSVGFVPTMGALHAGHRALLERCRAECDCTVLSLFVNPTQFNDKKDFEKYPITFEADLGLARECGIDYVFNPQHADLYRDDYRYRVSEKELSTRYCGAFRPGHFDGVLTVVLKLFELVRPTHAYFGEKDYQQLQLVRGMVEAFFLDIDIVPCATVRDHDGLALSSRNTRLSPRARAQAAEFPRQLHKPRASEATRAALETAGFTVDYVEDFAGRRLAAVHLDGVRLIDNVPVPTEGSPRREAKP
jgi:pantoate--beta-alanine ligase